MAEPTEHTKPNVPLVLAGINQVTASFAKNGIGKNRKNESQGFKFRGIDDVLNRMSDELVEANIVIIPRVTKREVYERVNQRGNPLFYVVLTVDYVIASTLDGSTVTCTTVGEAMDSGDKATNKALSIAYKYMAFQLFSIPIAEDPDAETHKVVANVATASAEELSIIAELAHKANVTPAFICNKYEIKRVDDLPQTKVQEVISNLQKKLTKDETA